MSAGLSLASAGIADQLSLRMEDAADRIDTGSSVEIGTTAAGVTLDITSCFCFLGFCSCWFPARKLPTTT